MMVFMLGSHFRFREIVDPRNLKDSTANRVLLSMVRGGSAGGLLLKSTVISTVLSVFSSRLLQPHHRTSCSTSRLYADSSSSRMRPITDVLSADFRSLTDGSPEVQSLVYREEQWGEHTSLGGTSADCPGAGYNFSQPHLLLPVYQEVCNPLTGGGMHSELGEFGEEDFWDDGVKRRAEVYKQHLFIRTWGVEVLQDVVQPHVDCIIH